MNDFERRQLEERKRQREANQNVQVREEVVESTPALVEKPDVDQAPQTPTVSEEPPVVSPPVAEPAQSAPVLPTQPDVIKKPKNALNNCKTVRIPSMPESIVKAVRAEMPNASSNSDALAAFVYAKLAQKPDVPEHIKDLSSTWKGNEVIDDIGKRMSLMESHVSKMMSSMTEFEVALAYLIFDRLGWRSDNPPRIDDIDFFEKGMTEMIGQLRHQSREYRRQENIRTGRELNYSDHNPNYKK